MTHFAKSILVRLVVVAGALFCFVQLASAQCEFPACNLKGERYDPKTGECQSGPDPITRALSHRVPSCGDGEHFDRATGNCVLDACGDGGCEARRLCPRDTRYSRSGHDRTGTYGVCESGPNWLGHRSHEIRRCPDGFTLNEARGVCVGNCRATVRRLPDLVIRRTFLKSLSGAPLTRVRAGTSYFACFDVANIGLVASGPFRVGGGGLGVPTAPTQAHASLLPGASRTGCLLYSTTPAAGSYSLGITADSRHTVGESHEDNNDATLPVVVVPR